MRFLLSSRQAASGDSLGYANKQVFRKRKMEQARHCAMPSSQKSPVACSLVRAACSETCCPTQERSEKNSFAIHHRPGSHSAWSPDSAAGRLWDLCGLMLRALRSKMKMSPSRSPMPCLPLQAGEWALGHCSAPTWCETAPLWHSACTFHGRRRPPPWPACRHRPLTDPHCSCGGESMRVSGGQGSSE